MGAFKKFEDTPIFELIQKRLPKEKVKTMKIFFQHPWHKGISISDT